MSMHQKAVESAARAIARRLDGVIPPDAFDAVRAALTEYRAAMRVTDREQFESLPDNSVFLDSSGDIGTIHLGKVWYPETAPISLTRAERFLPVTVLHYGGAKC